VNNLNDELCAGQVKAFVSITPTDVCKHDAGYCFKMVGEEAAMSHWSIVFFCA
jgi:hypothetical protein